MARLFPQNFDLRLFSGPRAKQFTKPEDAFQQLLGDALKEMAGPHAHISPTRGRDGSIDAFVVEGASLTGAFQGLNLPLIVECKTHDDAAKAIDRNILGQWALMEKKLEAQALDGWKDLFEPWLEARSYAYCVSAHIQGEQVRQKLTSAIEAFFASLPADYRPPLESVRVIDWNDLRQWLDASPRVSDSWLGVELELILDHETYLNRLSGFREYLLPSRLEFVPPAPESSFHPARIFAEIESADLRSEILLVGAGGIGKTRTAIEVGTLAANAGWRVLHVLPDEPGIETENIAEIVLPYADSQTLLVFDYIDQMQRLDLGSIRRSLIPAARERGIQLRLVANCRPGWMEINNPERDELFGVIELRPTETHKATLIETMASRIAPTASGILGQNEVLRLCGTRAIIALLIARELESRALANLLTDIDTASLRSGDLVQWLRRRLEENALSVKHDEPSLAPRRPEIPMVAAAAALACAPETRETLMLASESAYKSMDWPTANPDARFLVDLLSKFGWLEPHGMFNSTAHDVVADEVLDQTIHSEAIVFERELSAVLSITFAISRGIGRLATALHRVLGFAKSEEVTRSITEFLQGWLKSNAATLGEVLQAGDPDVTGYALGALLSGPPWEESAIERWEELFLPWLNAHSTKEEARHLLYKGLRIVGAQGAGLIASALIWLAKHYEDFSAQFVFSGLLLRDDLPAKDALDTIRFAVSWLQNFKFTDDARFVLSRLLKRDELVGDDAVLAKQFALLWLAQHHSTEAARFVSETLLERKDLSPDEATRTRRFAIFWLEQYHLTEAAGFLLPRLLAREDLSTDEATQARRFALLWLEQYHLTEDAGFVLKPLLAREDLYTEEATQARRFALLWLEQYHLTEDAGFVLKPLLEREDLYTEEATQAKRCALLWLEQYPLAERGQFVLKPLLEREDLSAEEATQAKRCALLWLEQYPLTEHGQFVLKPLLEREDLSAEEATAAKRCALLWLETHHATLDAGFVLPRVLDQIKDGSDDAAFVVESAVNWLQTFYETSDAEFVLKKLFRRDDVPQSEQSSLMTSAIRRLRQHLEDNDATFLLRTCLQYRINNEPLQRELVSLALDWLSLHPGNPDGEYVWNRILRYRLNLVCDNDWKEVARRALLWLKSKNFDGRGIEQTTNSILMRSHCLDADERDFLVGLAIRLLATKLHPHGRRKMIASLEYLARSLADEDPLKLRINEALGPQP